MAERYLPDDPREWLNRARSNLLLARAERLTRFAVFTRYPGVRPAASHQEYEETLNTAEEVVRWAEERLQ